METKSPKTYKIKTVKSRISLVEGNLEYLISYFRYTLEVGYSWDKKVNQAPKTIASFVKSLQRSYEAKEAQCYDRTFVELVK